MVGIADGDSLELLVDQEPKPFRLAGIDCPERGQPWAGQARRLTSELAHGKRVKIRITDEDRYGRAVGTLELPDGKELNQELLRAGLAWWYRSFAPDNITYRRLEEEAREAGRGLWRDPDPIPPWEWRRRGRK